MDRRIVAAAFAFVLVALPRPSWASSITQFVSFSGSAVDIELITPFDPSLGTLDSVSVGVQGILTVQGVTFPNLLGIVPLAYPYQVTVSQSFDGLAGQFFDFSSPSTFTFFGVDSGLGTGFNFTTVFTYGFQFTSFTDLLGLIVPTFSTSTGTLVPPVITGVRSDFVQGIPINQMQMVQTTSTLGLGGPNPLVTNLHTSVLMQIDYNYTPATPDPAPVPEPASLGLLGIGLAALVAFRRRSLKR